MKSKVKAIKKDNLAMPGKPLSKTGMKQLIKDAEQGGFITTDELEKRLKAWRNKTK
jgi:hypothetical protein